MKPIIASRDILFVVLFAITNLASSSTNAAHYAISVNLRYLLIAIAVMISFVSVSHILERGKTRYFHFSFILFFIVLVLVGVLQSQAFGGIGFFIEDPMLIVFLTLSFFFAVVLSNIIFAFDRGEIESFGGRKILVGYFLFSLFLMLVSGGLKIGIPPTINFELPDGEIRGYSQGFTILYAMAGVFLIVSAGEKSGNFLFSFILGTLFLVISVLGGGRGDLLAGVIALCAYLVRRPKISIIAPVLVMSFAAYVYVVQTGLWSEILVFQRFLAISESGWGERDVLAIKAVQLLALDPVCIFSGCGFNYFQVFWGHEYGLYPHNMFLETLITYGIFMGGGLVLFSIIGVAVSYFGWGKTNPLYYMFLVAYMSLLKSGSLLGFAALPLLSVFAILGMKWVFKTLIQSKKSLSNVGAKV